MTTIKSSSYNMTSNEQEQINILSTLVDSYSYAYLKRFNKSRLGKDAGLDECFYSPVTYHKYRRAKGK